MLHVGMTRDDLNALLNAAVDVASEHLQEQSEFAPFALAMQAEDGEILHMEADGESPYEDPDELRAVLVAGLREGAAQGRFRAVAIVTDVTLEDDNGQPVTSAIHTSLEHTDDEAVTCVVPYEIGTESVELGDLVAEPGEAVVFTEILEN